jgi:hypothetical protein
MLNHDGLFDLLGAVQRGASAREVVLDFLQGLALGLWQEEVEEDCAERRDDAVKPKGAVDSGQLLQQGERLDHGEDKHVTGAGRHSAQNSAHPRWVHLANHHPGDH